MCILVVELSHSCQAAVMVRVQKCSLSKKVFVKVALKTKLDLLMCETAHGGCSTVVGDACQDLVDLSFDKYIKTA